MTKHANIEKILKRRLLPGIAYIKNTCYFLFSGSKNDDCCRVDICSLLAALSHLLRHYWDLPTVKSLEIHSANLPSQLLACHELHNV